MSDSFWPPWAVARQAPIFMGLSRQEYWHGLPSPPPGGLPRSGIKPASLTSPALAGRFFISSAIWEALTSLVYTTFSLLIPQSFSILFFRQMIDQQNVKCLTILLIPKCLNKWVWHLFIYHRNIETLMERWLFRFCLAWCTSCHLRVGYFETLWFPLSHLSAGK